MHVSAFSRSDTKHYWNMMKLSGHWEGQDQQSLHSSTLLFLFCLSLFPAFAVNTAFFFFSFSFLRTSVLVKSEGAFVIPKKWRARAFWEAFVFFYKDPFCFLASVFPCSAWLKVPEGRWYVADQKPYLERIRLNRMQSPVFIFDLQKWQLHITNNIIRLN